MLNTLPRPHYVCSDCAFYSARKEDITNGTCHGNPPEMTVFPTANGNIAAKPLRPVVGMKEIACRHYQPRLSQNV